MEKSMGLPPFFLLAGPVTRRFSVVRNAHRMVMGLIPTSRCLTGLLVDHIEPTPTQNQTHCNHHCCFHKNLHMLVSTGDHRARQASILGYTLPCCSSCMIFSTSLAFSISGGWQHPSQPCTLSAIAYIQSGSGWPIP